MKGWLVIGGGNLEASETTIHKTLIEKAGGSKAVLCIVPTASGEDPKESIQHLRSLWMELGLQKEQIKVLPVYGGAKTAVCPGEKKAAPSERECTPLKEACVSSEEKCTPLKEERAPKKDVLCPRPGDDLQIVEMLEDVTGCWFTGGDQYYIHQAFLRENGEDTLALVRMKEIVSAGGVMGGTSAGAAIMSRQMIGAGNNKGALEQPLQKGYQGYQEETQEDAVRLVKGLGFFEAGIVDQHFDMRCRILRLIRALAENDEKVSLGYGVSEDTAMLYDGENHRIWVQGSGGVYIVDARDGVYHWKEGKFSCQGIHLHVLQEGDGFDLAKEEVEFGKSKDLL